MVAASSAALSRVTSTPRLASSRAPRAMLTVNMTGRATGTALIIRTRRRGSTSSIGRPRTKDKLSTRPNRTPRIAKSQRTRRATTSSICNFGRASRTSSAVRPYRVFSPISTTTASPSPERTIDPEASRSPGVPETSADSPVRADWSMRTDPDSILRSAGTKSPCLTLTISPGTSSLAGRRRQAESRSTRAATCNLSRKASTIPEALRSCRKLITALTTSNPPMTTASTRLPSATDRMRISSSIQADTPVNLPRNSTTGLRRSGAISLKPWAARRRATSAEARPAFGSVAGRSGDPACRSRTVMELCGLQGDSLLITTIPQK